jgi:hypothetical protein
VAAVVPGARVLSVASGHLREIEWSRAARSGTVAVTALDQDPDSLACIERDYGRYSVSTVPASIGDLIRGSLRFTDIDLAYAAGLYDYLPDDVARALTATLFTTLGRNGRLLIANFTTANHDAAFMETFMDWHLVYRTPAQLRALTDAIPAADVARIDQFSDENHHVAYLRLVKR